MEDSVEVGQLVYTWSEGKYTNSLNCTRTNLGSLMDLHVCWTGVLPEPGHSCCGSYLQQNNVATKLWFVQIEPICNSLRESRQLRSDETEGRANGLNLGSTRSGYILYGDCPKSSHLCSYNSCRKKQLTHSRLAVFFHTQYTRTPPRPRFFRAARMRGGERPKV